MATTPIALRGLVVALAQGDRTALDSVYRALWPPILQFCTSILRDPTDGEDVAQQTLLKFMDQVQNYDGETDPVQGAKAIAYWQCKSHLRKSWRLASRSRATSSSDHQPATQQQELEQKEQYQRLQGALTQLTNTERSAIQQLLTGNSPTGQTFRKQKQRAITRLRHWFGLIDQEHFP